MIKKILLALFILISLPVIYHFYSAKYLEYKDCQTIRRMNPLSIIKCSIINGMEVDE